MDSKKVAQYILENDSFSQWLGIKIIDIKDKYCLLEMKIRQEMINGLKSVHGGVLFSFADSALALSANNTNEASVALNCTISFVKASWNGDVLRAESKLVSETNKTGIYDIRVTNDKGELVAMFMGTAYKLNRKVTEL